MMGKGKREGLGRRGVKGVLGRGERGRGRG